VVAAVAKAAVVAVVADAEGAGSHALLSVGCVGSSDGTALSVMDCVLSVVDTALSVVV
jgi:hypothetical protein